MDCRRVAAVAVRTTRPQWDGFHFWCQKLSRTRWVKCGERYGLRRGRATLKSRLTCKMGAFEGWIAGIASSWLDPVPIHQGWNLYSKEVLPVRWGGIPIIVVFLLHNRQCFHVAIWCWQTSIQKRDDITRLPLLQSRRPGCWVRMERCEFLRKPVLVLAGRWYTSIYINKVQNQVHYMNNKMIWVHQFPDGEVH